MNHSKRITLSQDNVYRFPSFKKLVDEGKIVIDAHGTLRYPHGAPVGELVFSRVRKDGTPIYKESAEEWFDPESPMAKAFVWPT